MDLKVKFNQLTTRQGKIGCSSFTYYNFKEKMYVEKKEIVDVMLEFL